MRAHGRAVMTGHSRDRHGLHRQDREHARHEVQDQPARQRQQQHLRNGLRGAAVRLGRHQGHVGRRRDLKITRRPARVMQHQKPSQPGIGIERRDGLQRDPESTVLHRQRLRRAGINRLAEREELRAAHRRGQRPVGCKAQCAIGRDLRGIGGDNGRAGGGSGEQRCLLGRARRARRQVECEVALLWHADLLAHEPRRMRPQCGGARGGRGRERQHDVASIGKGRERPFRGLLRRRPQDRPGRKPRLGRERQLGRHPSIARVLPIGVPARRQAQPKGGMERHARCCLIGVGDQGHGGACAADGRALQRVGRCREA